MTMERRTFLLGLFGGLAAATGLAAAAHAAPTSVPLPADEAANITAADLDEVRTEEAQYGRRHHHRHHRAAKLEQLGCKDQR